MTPRMQKAEQGKQDFYRRRARALADRRQVQLCLLGGACCLLLILWMPIPPLSGIPAVTQHWISGGVLSLGFLVLLMAFGYELFFDSYWQRMARFYEVEYPKLLEKLAQKDAILARYDLVAAETEGRKGLTWKVICARHSDEDVFSLGLRLEDRPHVYLFARGLTEQEADYLMTRIDAGEVKFSDLIERYDLTPVSVVPGQEEEGLS
jgi:hypothetical protein